MSILKTPTDLGNVIRQRRKALGWDQARLAHETGVSRQWIIEIEKGKPRAELQLVLRALNVLGINLTTVAPASPALATPDLGLADIDAIIERSRVPVPLAACNDGTYPRQAMVDASKATPRVAEPTPLYAQTQQKLHDMMEAATRFASRHPVTAKPNDRNKKG